MFELKKEVKTYDELTTIINKKLDNYNRTNYYDYIITLNDNKIVGEVSVPFYNDLLKTIELNLILDRNYNNYASSCGDWCRLRRRCQRNRKGQNFRNSASL